MLDYTPPPSHNVEPAAYVQELPKHFHHHRHHHRHGHHHWEHHPDGHNPGHIVIKRHLHMAKAEVTNQSVTPVTATTVTPIAVKDAFAVIDATPLDAGIKDKPIARNFRDKFAVPLAAVLNALTKIGFHPKIGSGVRTPAIQAALDNPNKAKGVSEHELGYAADIFHGAGDAPKPFYAALHKYALAYHLQTVPGKSELPHIQLARNQIDTRGYAAGVINRRHHYGKMQMASISVVGRARDTGTSEAPTYPKITVKYNYTLDAPSA